MKSSAGHNKSIDVRAKQRLSYQRLLVNSKLRSCNFRHLKRWLPRGEMMRTNAKQCYSDLCAVNANNFRKSLTTSVTRKI